MGDAKDSQSRRSIGDMRWNRFVAILLGLIGAVAAGIVIALPKLDEGPQIASSEPVSAAATPLPPLDPASEPVTASGSK